MTDNSLPIEQQLQAAEKAVEQHKQALGSLLSEKYEPIAIVGAGVRMPGDCDDLDSFTDLLNQGKSGTGPIPKNRWDNEAYHTSERGEAGKISTLGGGFIRDHDAFDARFFSISPKEAQYMDPQQRLVMEVSWQALENANISPDTLIHSDGGVYMGISSVDYSNLAATMAQDTLESQIGTGTAHSAIAGRVSYFLGWRGPSVAIDTACSSSLVAVHQAIAGLRRKECNIALAGGVNVIHDTMNHIVFSRAGMLAPDGQCKTFDDSADGYGRSEGCGVVVLKRLSDAQKDNDNILAVLRGSSVRQDGESGGLTVPNGTAQEMVMKKAIADAALSASDINYVEAHGTGTSLGDPIEMRAINQVFNSVFSSDKPLPVGSVKTNIGHMEAAAGMGGLIKVALQLKNSTIYPHINLQTPSSHIPWDQYPITIPTQTQAWQANHKRALVNSFGFAGTISTVVVEQAPVSHATQAATQATTQAATQTKGKTAKAGHLLTLSAKSQPSLSALIGQYQQLAADPATDLAALCQTSQLGRAHHAYRIAGAVDSHAELSGFLERSGKRLAKDNFRIDQLGAGGKNWQQALLFTGQGAQYVGMGASLYQHYGAFKYFVDICDQAFARHIDVSIKAIMFGETADAAELINQTRYTQPALFTLEYALAMTLLSWGLKPSVLIGHSIGEIAAACVAGLFNLDDAIKLVSTRATLMQSVKASGGMTAVKASEAVLAPLVAEQPALAFAALNAPEQVVISGATDALTQLHQQLEQQQIEYRPLAVSHAFHSPLMNEVFDDFTAVFDQITFNTPHITLISNLTGQIADIEQMSTAQYWVEHIGQPVRFAAGMKAVEARGQHLFIEVGPSAALTALGKQSVAVKDHRWIPMLDKKADAVLALNRGLALCYDNGVNLDWAAVYRGQTLTKVTLPLYPFDKKRYWMTQSKGKNIGQMMDANHPLLGNELVNNAGETEEFRRFVAAIGTDAPGYLAEHVVMDQVIFPGAGYIELALALADKVYGDSSLRIGGLSIEEPLILKNDESCELNTKIWPLDNDQSRFEVVSVHGEGDEQFERRHVSGHFVHEAGYTSAPAADDVAKNLLQRLQDSQQQDPQKMFQSDSLYGDFADIGLNYGRQFQKIAGAATFNDLVVVAELHAHDADGTELLNPSILDGAMQSIATLINDENTYLPIGFDHCQLFKKPKGETRVCLQLRSTEVAEDKTLRADLLLVDAYGLVFVAQGLTLKQAPRSPRLGKTLVHESRWTRKSFEVDAAQQNVGKQLVIGAFDLAAETAVPVIVTSDVDQALARLRQDDSIVAISYLWPDGESCDSVSELQSCAKSHYDALIQLVKQLESEFVNRQLQLFLVTQNAQVLPGRADNSADNQLLAASLWGFGATLLNEHPGLSVTLIDVDDQAVLLDEWRLTERRDFRVAYCAGQRFIQQIAPVETTAAAENVELAIDDYGLFSNLKFKPIERVAPAKGEVQIAVKAAGLNFKDVLNALGMLKEYADTKGIEYHKLPLGFECSGVVVAAADDAEFKVGDEVIVSQLGCMAQYITVSCDVVVRKPRNISFAQAAGLATAYVTAYYSLHHLAELKANEKVLIHAGAGGVGQAAIELSKRMNAQIFATASEAKWPVLEAQGVNHIMNSRTLDFAAQIEQITGGSGVDVLVNSLNKDFIPKGIDSMAQNGRFVELGKIGVWSDDEVAQRRADIRYDNFDLSELPSAQLNALNKEILTKVVDLIEAEEVQPLPTSVYAMDEVEEAFGTLSRGANIGKLVISFEQSGFAQPAPLTVVPEHAVLITGGLGALGLKTAAWLANEGARELVLMSRREISEEQLAQVRKTIGGKDVNVTVVTGDVTCEQDVKQVMEQVKQIAPLGGIIHAAGVLADMPVTSMTWEAIEQVFSAKVYGTWLLHQHSRDIDSLNYFVCYSSIAAMLGSATQANYAAANAYIDQLMQWRCANGLPGLAIQWGPWAEVGMAADLSDSLTRAIEDKGIKFLKPGQGIKAMHRLLSQAADRKAVCGFDWDSYLRQQLVEQSLFGRVGSGESQVSSLFDVALFDSLGAGEQGQMINELVREKVAIVLQFDGADDIESDARFADLGLDSLVAVELKNALEMTFKVPLQTAVLYDYPGVNLLSDYLKGKLAPLDAQAAMAEPEVEQVAMADEDIDDELAQLADL